MFDPSVLSMDRKNFSYKKEMRALFNSHAEKTGALGLD